MRLGRQNLFAIVSGLIVLAAVVAGMVVVGSPRRARERALDTQRVQALQTLSNAVGQFRRAHGALPDTLTRLAQDQNDLAPSDLRDPETATPYEYRATGAASYELCARFATNSDEDEVIRWRHGTGRACFSLTADGQRSRAAMAAPFVGTGSVVGQ
ncbi:MAG: hypothetical protein P4M09_14285 [Devosia sp.]|nr:hypothetical protein [Devosia sp.]